MSDQNSISQTFEYLTVAEVTKLLPNRPSVVTVWRWFARGVHGEKLKIVRAGRSPLTTRIWLDDFLERVEAARARAAEVADAEVAV